MSGVWVFDLIDSAGLKLYTFKLTQYNSNAPAPGTQPGNSPYENPSSQDIYYSDAFSMEVTYAFDAIIPTVTTLGIYYTPDGSLSDPAAGKFYLRFTTDSKSIYESQAGRYDPTGVQTPNTGTNGGNYIAIATSAVPDIVYTFGPAQAPSGKFFLNSFPIVPSGAGVGNLDNTVETSSIIVPVALPTDADVTGLRTNSKGSTYYINRLLKMGYTMNQIIPSSLYTSYISVDMTFPSYELRQLFMDGNLALNGCRCDKGRIY